MVEQLSGDPFVLAGDQVGERKQRFRAIAQVSQVADRRRHDIEARRRRWFHGFDIGRWAICAASTERIVWPETAVAGADDRVSRGPRIGLPDAAPQGGAAPRTDCADAADGTRDRSGTANRRSASSRRLAGPAERRECRGGPLDRQYGDDGVARFEIGKRADHDL